MRLRGAGDVDGARLAFQRAIDFGDLHGTPAGLWWMEEKARAVYERATGGDREQQALFAINPAEELKERGDVDGAAESLREAIELDDPHASPRAATMLSLLPSR